MKPPVLALPAHQTHPSLQASIAEGEKATEHLEAAVRHREGVIGERDAAIADLEQKLHNTAGLQHQIDDLRTEVHEKSMRIV